VDLELSDGEVASLEQLSRVGLGFPHDFEGRALAHGTTFDLVDDHRGQVYTELESPPRIATADTDGSE
jgi:hypothetical protein